MILKMANNEALALCRLRIRPKILKGASHIDLSTAVMGKTIDMPVCVAPTAMQKMAHSDGEIATAKGNSVFVAQISLLLIGNILVNVTLQRNTAWAV